MYYEILNWIEMFIIEIVKIIYNYNFLFFVFSGVWGGVLHYSFLSRLRKKHVEKWEELGKPALFTNNTALNTFKVHKFLWTGEYKNLEDQKLNRTVKRLRITNSIIGIMFFVYLCNFVILLNR